MKDALGHGSDSRGSEGAAAHQSGVSTLGGWQTHIGGWSTDPRRTGDLPARMVTESHGNPVDAMRHLNDAIDRRAGDHIGISGTYHITSPTGAHMSLFDTYKHVFGQEPKVGRGGTYTFPKIRRGEK